MSFKHFFLCQYHLISCRYARYSNHLYDALRSLNLDDIKTRMGFFQVQIKPVENIMFDSEYNQKHMVDGYVCYHRTLSLANETNYILVNRCGDYVFTIQYQNIDLDKHPHIKKFLLEKINETHKKIVDETVS